MHGQVRVPGAIESSRVVGLNLTLPKGWTARITNGCGDKIAQSGGAATVKFRITMTEQAAPGSGSEFALADGVKVAPVSQDAPLECEQS